MDKSKWEYKKLGEVATFLNGYAFKPENWSKHGLKIIRIQNLTDKTAPYNCYDGDIDSKYIVRKGDLLISWSATLGAFLWDNNDALLNQHIFKTIFDKSDIDKYYLKYCVISKLEEMAKKSHGVTMRHITKKDFDNTIIPYPSLLDQQRIVAELDCLNEMIAVKQEQLKEFDKLAQSIFYDMFGDPVSNDKGWDKSLMGDVCDIIAGGDKPNDISTVKTADYCYPVIANGDGEKGILGYSKNRRVEDDSVTIGARGASIGNCRIVYGGYTPVVRLISLTPQKRLNCVYLYYYANQMHYSSTGAGQAQLTVPNVKKAPIPLPPLSLQQQFADKISAIEAQKELVKQSIAETQTLLDYTMDYYFN